MFAVHLLCYPWDLERDGIENVLDRAQGQIGVTGVTFVAACRPMTVLRTLLVRDDTPSPSRNHPAIVRSAGGIFFHPNPEHYRHTRCKPNRNRLAKSRDLLAQWIEAATRRSLPVRVLTDTRRIGMIAAGDESLATQSAFGDRSPDCLCYNNPDVVAFFGALLVDLADRDNISAVVLRGLENPLDNGLLDSVADPRANTAAIRDLFGLCFCESCAHAAAAAELQVDDAQRSVRKRLASAIHSSGDSETVVDLRDPPIDRYLRFQRAAFRAMIQRLTTTQRLPLRLIVAPSRNEPNDDLIDVPAPHAAVVKMPSPGDDTAQQRVRSCMERSPTDCEAWLPVSPAAAHEPANAVRLLKQLADMGVSAVTLDHLGMLGPAESDAARQAIRYATRATGSPRV